MTRALAYLRQSKSRTRDDLDGGSVSLASQLNAVQTYCDGHNITLAAWHSDIDESGASHTRQGLNQFLSDVDRIKPDLAVFWDVKRLVRDLRLFLDVFDRLQAAGTEIVSVTEGSRNPAFVWKLLALMAEEERDRIAQNIIHAKREAAKRGRHQGTPPLGYVRIEGMILPDPDTRFIPERLFALALEGHTPQAIARLANAEGLPTMGMVRAKGNGTTEAVPSGSPGEAPVHCSSDTPSIARWSRQTVIQVLRCVTYAGLVQSGKHASSRHGRALGVIVASAPHEPLIPRATFDAVQRHLDARRHPASARRGSWHWLAGRIVCACGQNMYYLDAARTDSDRRDRSFRCRASYKTRYGINTPGCPLPKSRLSAPMIERTVDALMLAALTHAARVRDPAALQRAHAARQGSGAVSQRTRAEKRLQELRAQRVRINDAIQQGIGDLPDLAVRDRALIEAIAAAEIELAAVPAPVSEPVARDALTMAARMRDEWTASTPQERATWATETGLRVIVNATTGNVELRFSEPFASLFG
jgi:DNA invertase Pin-like site-specific DNA recombinase